VETPTPLDPPTALEHDPGFVEDDDAGLDAEGELLVDDEDREVAAEDDDDVEAGEYDLDEHGVGAPPQGVSGADSSIRGGSDRARGYDRSGNEYEGSADKMDSRVKADSSIRGGSNEARGQGWRHNDHNDTEPGDARLDRRYKADSSIRGGSDRARGWDLKDSRTKDETDRKHSSLDTDLSVDTDAGSSAEFESDTDISGRDNEDMDLSGSYDSDLDDVSSSDLDADADINMEEASGSAAGAESESGSSDDLNSDDSDDLSSDQDQFSGESTLEDAEPESSGSAVESETDSSRSEAGEEVEVEGQLGYIDEPVGSSATHESRSDMPEHDPSDVHYDGQLDDADPDAGEASGAPGEFESESSTSEEDSSLDSESNTDPETGASELGRFSIESESDASGSRTYDTEAHAEIATELGEDQPSARFEYDRSEDDLSIEMDSELNETRDSIGSPGGSQSESATSSDSDDSDVNAGIRVDADSDVQAEDPYHPSDTRSGFEASGGLEGVESDSSSSETDLELDVETRTDEETSINNSDSYQPDFESDASIRSGSESEDSEALHGEAFPDSEARDLFRSNPAQGVGGPAGFQHESASSAAPGNDLAAKVKSQLSKDSTGTFGPMKNEIRNVEVKADENGKVTLTGSVSSEQHKRMIELRAKETVGVRSVDNQLTVSADALPQNREDGLGSSQNLEERRDEFQD